MKSFNIKLRKRTSFNYTKDSQQKIKFQHLIKRKIYSSTSELYNLYY